MSSWSRGDLESEVERVAAARERRGLLQPALLAAAVILLVTFMTGAVLVLTQASPDADMSTKLVVLGGVVVVWLLVTALAAAGLAWGFSRLRRRGWPALARSPLWELESATERRALVQAIRRDEQIPPGQEQLALRTARHLVAGRRWRWVTRAVAVVVVVVWFAFGVPWWVIAAYVVIYLVAEITRRRSKAQDVAAVPRLERLVGSAQSSSESSSE